MSDWKEDRAEREAAMRVPLIVVASVPFVFVAFVAVALATGSTVPLTIALAVLIAQGAIGVTLGARVLLGRERIPRARLRR